MERPISTDMASFSLETWAVMALLSLGLVTAVLHTLARYLQAERELHELRQRVRDVRTSYARRLAEIAERAGEVIEVAPITDQPDTVGSIGGQSRRMAA